MLTVLVGRRALMQGERPVRQASPNGGGEDIQRVIQPLTTIKEMQMKTSAVTFPPAKLGKIVSQDDSCAGRLAGWCWHCLTGTC